MRRLTTGIRYEKCVVRRFRRCANVTESTVNIIIFDMYALFFIDMYAMLQSPATLTEGFPCFFLSCKANDRV
jgi:hypothetical protein